MPSYWLKVAELMICGGTAGAISSSVTYPLDLARSRLAVTLDLHPEVGIYHLLFLNLVQY